MELKGKQNMRKFKTTSSTKFTNKNMGFDSPQLQSMKIYNKPTKEHNQLQTKKHKHIQKTRHGYVIRKTTNGITYYYGCYNTLNEAITIEHKLSKHKYTPRLSQQNNHRKGTEYTQWLQQQLDKY